MRSIYLHTQVRINVLQEDCQCYNVVTALNTLLLAGIPPISPERSIVQTQMRTNALRGQSILIHKCEQMYCKRKTVNAATLS